MTQKKNAQDMEFNSILMVSDMKVTDFTILFGALLNNTG